MKSKNGYNITTGGAGCPKPNLTFKERVGLSKLFSLLDILDIQNRMIKGEKSSTIIKDYPKLTRSMFDNINLGLNFKNENLEYPLHNYRKDLSIKFTIEEIHAIKKEIIEKKTPFKEIAEKWEVSLSTISLVNNGKQWYEEQYTYPLRYGNSNYIYNANTWVKDVQDDLLHSSLPMTEIAKKYNKAYSTIKKINSGASHKKEIYRYPLTSNRT